MNEPARNLPRCRPFRAAALPPFPLRAAFHIL
jgi:hypothetical protein